MARDVGERVLLRGRSTLFRRSARWGWKSHQARPSVDGVYGGVPGEAAGSGGGWGMPGVPGIDEPYVPALPLGESGRDKSGISAWLQSTTLDRREP